MKQQPILSITLILLFATCISAQSTDKTVESIRKRYTEFAEKARLAEADEEHGQYDELFMNELVVNKLDHQWRAVGKHIFTYKFFYKMLDGDREDHMYPDQLVLVKVERKESDRTYSEEYLYSNAGVLMFYCQKAENDDQSSAERRVYFSGIKAIRIVEGTKTRNRLTAKDAAAMKEIIAQSGKIKEIFNRSIKL